MTKRYEVFITETTTRRAVLVVDVADNQDSYEAERIAQQRKANGEAIAWDEPETVFRMTGCIARAESDYRRISLDKRCRTS